MSLSQAKHLAHNMRAKAEERGDKEASDLAQVLYQIAEGLEHEHRDIKNLLQQVQHQVRNLH